MKTRKPSKGYVLCGDCRGTGAEQYDCWLCKGRRDIRATLAYRHGFRKADLEDLEDDGYCDCPACGGHSCYWCGGDGEVAADIPEQQETRVLIFGLTQSIPPMRVREWWNGGRVRMDDDALLSRAAAASCREKGWTHWFCSVFGDEIYLTDAGKAEAERRHVDFLASFDANNAALDADGRYDDDGGAPAPEAGL
jgi:hypothetical protein